MHDLTLDSLPPFVWLVAVQPPDINDAEQSDSLDELARLAKTLGAEVKGRLIQKRANPDASTVVGPGKVVELKDWIAASRAENPDRDHWLMIDREITPSQVRQLAKQCDAEVLDRTGVILEIFHRHARSRAAKAQVELVRLAYLAPRLREMRKGRGERQGGGIGAKGSGESALELDRRKIRDRLSELRLELERIQREQATQRARRHGVRRVALVGYTNAGKSTLMSALTGSEVYIADKLFATLDTTVRTLHPPADPAIVVSDTVGFIRKLPHDLVASFRSTLDEALEASLLLHLVDGSDPAYDQHIATTKAVLEEIGAGSIDARLVFNKCDKLTIEQREVLESAHPEAWFVSAVKPESVAALRELVVAYFDGATEEAVLRVPHTRGELRAALLAQAELLEERYDEDGGEYRVRAPAGVLQSLRERGATG